MDEYRQVLGDLVYTGVGTHHTYMVIGENQARQWFARYLIKQTIKKHLTVLFYC